MQQQLQQALVLHQNGQLLQAQALYEQILIAQPKNPDALHLLGVIALQTGDHTKAVDLISKAITNCPNNAGFHSNRGLALHGLKQMDAAIADYTRAIALQPDHAEAYFNRGLARYELNQTDAAIADYSQAISLKPDYVQAYSNRALAFQATHQPGAAVADYSEAIKLNPNLAEEYTNLGLAFQSLNQLDAALACHDRAIAIKPNLAEAYSNRGATLQALSQLDAALANHNQAVALKPDSAVAYSNRGATLQALGRLDAAITDFNQAIALKPDYAEAYSNRGTALQALNQLEAALANHYQAIVLKPEHAQAYSNLGATLQALNQLEAAISSYDQAIRLQPDHAEAQANKSMALLLSGDFVNGWVSYEWRWENKKTGLQKRNFSQPRWSGAESISGKTILLYAEQGLGDTLQFCRYAKLVNDLGTRVILEVPPALSGLLDKLDGVSELVTQGAPLPDFDYHCPLLSAPQAFKTDLGSIPRAARYLSSDTEKCAYWEKKLGAKDAPRIGLAWSGSTGHINDHNRSIELQRLLQYLPDGLQYISLQRDVRTADMEVLRQFPDILHFGDELHDFTDTAALCEQVDLVISVDTSITHLSAALGKPTWILLPFSPDWRWLLDREDSPWYPSAKLYRQENTGNWHGILTRLNRDLTQMAKQEPTKVAT